MLTLLIPDYRVLVNCTITPKSDAISSGRAFAFFCKRHDALNGQLDFFVMRFV